MTAPVLLWFRQDLRLSDQAALIAAASEGPVVPVYVRDDDTPRQWAMGGASRWWLHHSLASLDRALREKGSRLTLRRGKSADVLQALAKECGAERVHALHHYEPWWRNAEKAVAKALDLCLHDGILLLPPGAVRTGSGGIYKIYTPFARAVMEQMPPAAPNRTPATIDAPGHIDDPWPAEVTWGELATEKGRQPTWERETRTCSDTYCHGGVAGGSTLAPQWDDLSGARSACNTCHGMPPPPPHPGATSCEGCHGAVAGPAGTFTDPSLHLDGTVQFN